MKYNIYTTLAIENTTSYSGSTNDLKSRFEYSNLISQGGDFLKLTTVR